ncbi:MULTISPECIES: hypothetical protein [unclassified Paenibacillus]|uniref:hypothetical protein n=1 Tax=unclassified Paenibacillus TaxID=185978 RepID=UPI00278388A4|nr:MULTISPECIES: hypothetical protein [unclassified Paenibacillus]MDQ0899145.1 hypothetical protein [Paenibacillus sp. V4I7]MDQ0914870.1 hypothetical protein [Paenibacillus sp. V4I5]
MATVNKYVIIVQANQQDVGKAVHGLLYGQELHDEGFEVEILFDGAGTEWPNELSKADHPFNALYKQVMKSGIIKGGCQACSGFHEIEEEIQEAGVSLIGNEKTGGHIPFVQYIKDGFFPIIL